MTFDPHTGIEFADLLQARLESLTADIFITVPVVAKPARGYVVADISGGEEWSERASTHTSDASGLAVVRSCGYTPEQALHTDALVAARLRDWLPFADGTPLRCINVGTTAIDTSIPTDVRWSISRTYTYTH